MVRFWWNVLGWWLLGGERQQSSVVSDPHHNARRAHAADVVFVKCNFMTKKICWNFGSKLDFIPKTILSCGHTWQVAGWMHTRSNTSSLEKAANPLCVEPLAGKLVVGHGIFLSLTVQKRHLEKLSFKKTSRQQGLCWTWLWSLQRYTGTKNRRLHCSWCC